MPALDQCEPQVINALHKAGWEVTHQPFPLRVSDDEKRSYVFADLRLNHTQNNRQIIVIEVKCFADLRTYFDDLYQAIGQYIVYRNALKLNGMDLPLYLAVPIHVYSTFFQKRLIQNTLQDIHLELVVIDLKKEEVVSWIT